MATITIGSNTYDAFADVAFADEYLAADPLRAAPWATRLTEAKSRGLIGATRMLLRLVWCDTPPDPAVDPAPVTVQEVTAMLASDLLANPKLFSGASTNSNVKVARAGSASVEFFSPVSGAPTIPDELWQMLVSAGLVGCVGTLDSGLEGAYVSGAWDGCGCAPGSCRCGWCTPDRGYW